MSNHIIEYIRDYQAVLDTHLSHVVCSEIPEDSLGWTKKNIHENACFSNAMVMSLIHDCDLVIGYVYIDELGIAIEHAWNCIDDVHFDVTAQLHWNDNATSQYVQLIKFNEEQAGDFYQKHKGVDHLVLRRSPTYSYLFR